MMQEYNLEIYLNNLCFTMLYLFRYLPKQVTLDIFVLDNFMFYNDISIMYLDYFWLREQPNKS